MYNLALDIQLGVSVGIVSDLILDSGTLGESSNVTHEVFDALSASVVPVLGIFSVDAQQAQIGVSFTFNKASVFALCNFIASVAYLQGTMLSIHPSRSG